MLKSMTGFASASGANDVMRWDWEMRSVNGKGLDLRLRLPDGADAVEAAARKAAARVLSRGSVTITLRVHKASATGTAVVSDPAMQAALLAVKSAEDAALATGVDLAPTTAAAVLSLPGVMRAEAEKTELPAALSDEIPGLVAALDAMRTSEGAAIGEMLSRQLDQVADIVAASAKTAEARDARAGDILRQRVAALTEASDAADPARLQQELAILAVKADVTEEIDRLNAHVAAARELLAAGGVVGRKLDFLMQEFNREANTLCSKAGSVDLTALGLELKVIIDQMREQVQNLE